MIGKGGHEADQQHGRDVAEAEPQQEQRRIGDARDRRAHADERQQHILGEARAAHGDADHDAGQGGQREAGNQPQQRVERMMRQHARCGQPHEGGGHDLQRRKQPRREDAMRATSSHSAPTTRNGNAVRAAARQRDSAADDEPVRSSRCGIYIGTLHCGSDPRHAGNAGMAPTLAHFLRAPIAHRTPRSSSLMPAMPDPDRPRLVAVRSR